MALELLLLRHGEAMLSLPDAKRSLSVRGIEQTRAVLKRRIEALSGLTAVYVSPLRRAQQTLGLVAEIIELPAPLRFDGLQPEASVTQLIEWLQPQQGKILLVAHNPLLSYLLGRLLGEGPVYTFDTSTLVCTTMPVAAAGCADLSWIESP
ncbi:MAG: phosphohistidine phosphatase [Motiliproteus sp.]|jgi:phosphohistidine phosphatase